MPSSITQDIKQRIANLSPAKRALLEERLKKRPSRPDEQSSIMPRKDPGSAPLSFAQLRMWFLDQFEPDSGFYNIPVVWRLVGALDGRALDRALNAIVERHEALRTGFAVQDSQPIQVIVPSLRLDLEVIDLRAQAPDLREANVQRLTTEEAARPFDLAQAPLVRFTLLRLQEQEHVLLLTMHHIVSDGWSMTVFGRELALLYEAFCQGRPSPLPPLPIQYADFAEWQRRWFQGPVLDRQLQYWKTRLKGAPPVLDLPLDRLRPPAQSFNGASAQVVLPPDLAEGLKTLARLEGATLFMALLAAFKVLLYRYSGQTDIVLGSPIAARNRMEIENLIGFFVNTLVLRTDLSGDPSFRQLLARVREVTLGGYEHQDLPFERLVEEMQPERTLSHSPLFQVLFALQNTPDKYFKLYGLTLTPIFVDSGMARFDLALIMEETAEGLVSQMTYNTDLFDRATIRRMQDHMTSLIRGILADPDRPIGRLTFLTEPECRLLLAEWNATAADYPADCCIHRLFEAQAEKAPDAVAVVFEEQQLTYAELNRRANQLARYLNGLGIGPETLVGLFMDRGVEMIIGIYGILKAGGAYVPLDPDYPPDRVAYMMEDSRLSVILTQAHLAAGLASRQAKIVCLDSQWETIGRLPADNLPDTLISECLAYVIYTSGSTGTPKGVMVAHRAICNHAAWIQSCFHLTAADIVLQRTPFSFDPSVCEFFAPLTVGARLIIPHSGKNQDAGYLVELMADHKVTFVIVVPSHLAMLLDEKGFETCRHLSRIFTGGEPLTPELRRRCAARTDAELINLYGPTETCINSTFWVCQGDDQQSTIPIGKPIANTQVYLLDGHLNPVPVGVLGELYIGGHGLARGYLNRPELTADRFIADPFGSQPGSRLYKTGDLCRYLPDGNLDFCGRNDHQVKINGFRIELGEIEAALKHHPALRDVVVLAREDQPGDKRLVAYIVSDPQPATTPTELRSFLKQRLPGYMLPSAFVPVAALPLTPNGKIDLKALPPPDRLQHFEDDYLAPRTPLESQLAEIWCEILGIDRVGVHNNFFELGGHSLLATRMMSRLRSALKVEVPLRTLFAAPTIAELALAAARLQARQTPDEPPLERRENPGAGPLSFAQQRLWFLDQYEPNSAAYNIPVAWRLAGTLNREALHRALNALVERHETLRTRFSVTDGQPIQVIEAPLALNLSVTDLTAETPDGRESQVRRLAAEVAQRPFDLGKAPLMRCTLIRLEGQTHVLLLTLHHIVSDGWSMGIFARELGILYEAYNQGQSPALSPLPIQYADFADWQRQWFQGPVLDQQLAYWKTQLEGAPPVLNLPLDRPRPPAQSFKGASINVLLPPGLAEGLRDLARKQDATLFMALLAAFKVLLNRYTRQTDIVVGSPIAARNRAEIENLIGFFVNTLVLRTDLSGNPGFRQLLARVREITLGGFEHQDLPFEKLVEAMQPERTRSYNPLFQVMFALQNIPQKPLALPELTLQPLNFDSGLAKFDLILFVEEVDEGLSLTMNYSTDLFDSTSIQRMLGHYRVLLEGILADSDRPIAELPLLTDIERRQILVDWNATAGDYPKDLCIHQLFEQQAARRPENVAIAFKERQLTYAQLNSRANQLAHHLRRLGVGPDVLVGICLERSPELVVGLLAILKAGGAYVPLDVSYPKPRIAFMLEDSGISVLLTQASWKDQLADHPATVLCLDSDWDAIERESRQNLQINTAPHHLAYINYTSGSTGRPKGVEIPHRAVVRLVCGCDYVQLAADRVFLHMSTISFDAATFELWGSLLHGAKCVLLDEQVPGPGNLKRIIARHKIDTLFITTGLFNLIIDTDPQVLSPVRQILTGGEAASAVHIQRALDVLPNTRLSNVYGPTESTTFTTHCPLSREKTAHRPSIPIGRPIANTRVHILDEHLQPLPVGVPGELYIGGDGLARGYLNRQELTADKFISDPFSPDSGQRLYKTGDLACYLPDGNIEFLERIDQQIKIRGFRIEMGEIETVLAGHPQVQQAVVIVREDTPQDRRLVAYVTFKQQSHPSGGELRAFVGKYLPAYMVPAAIVAMSDMPLTPNGKVDRKALPLPDRTQLGESNDFVAPRNKLELQLTKIWEKVLDFRPIGVKDNFFHVGGHSLLAVRLLSEIQKITGQGLPVAALFQAPTVEQLVGILRQKSWSSPWSWLVPIQPYGSRIPYFQVHGTVNIVRYLEADQPYYELDYHGTDGGLHPVFKTTEQKAADYIREMRTVHPKGPYHLCGFSFGGLVAIEMARQLARQGEQVPLLFLLDPSVPINYQTGARCPAADGEKPPDSAPWRFKTLQMRRRLNRLAARPGQASGAERLKLKIAKKIGAIRNFTKTMVCKAHLAFQRPVPKGLRRFYMSQLYHRAARQYVAEPYPGPVVLYHSHKNPNEVNWKALFVGELEIHHLSKGHMDFIEEPHIQIWAGRLIAGLEKVHAEAQNKPG